MEVELGQKINSGENDRKIIFDSPVVMHDMSPKLWSYGLYAPIVVSGATMELCDESVPWPMRASDYLGDEGVLPRVLEFFLRFPLLLIDRFNGKRIHPWPMRASDKALVASTADERLSYVAVLPCGIFLKVMTKCPPKTLPIFRAWRPPFPSR